MWVTSLLLGGDGTLRQPETKLNPSTLKNCEKHGFEKPNKKYGLDSKNDSFLTLRVVHPTGHHFFYSVLMFV